MNNTLTEAQYLSLMPKANLWKRFFWFNRKNILRGGLRYLLRHPIGGPKVAYARFKYARSKQIPVEPVISPEGFPLREEINIYSSTFIEQNLYYRRFLKDFRWQLNSPLVIDVGACWGDFCQWLAGYNDNAVFYAIEPLPNHYMRGEKFQECRSDGLKPNIHWIKAAASNYNADEVTLHIGEAVSLQELRRAKFSLKVPVVSIDSLKLNLDYPLGQFGVFCLKIDSDGSNMEVLEGAVKTLEKTKWVILEDEPKCAKFLTQLGFEEVYQSSPVDKFFLNNHI